MIFLKLLKKTNLCLILVLFASQNLFAKDFTVHQLAIAYPYALKHFGIEKIHDLDLDTLIREMAEVRVQVQGNVFFIGTGSKTRSGSVYNVEEKSVLFNQLAHQNLIAANSSMLTNHEFMGALGYIDDDYQFSAAMAYLAAKFQVNPKLEKDKVEILLRSPIFDAFKNIKKRTKSPRYKIENASDGGSATGVGGGGDGDAILLKTYLFIFIDQLFAKHDTYLNSSREAITKAKIESFQPKSWSIATAEAVMKIKNDCIKIGQGENSEYLTFSKPCWSFVNSLLLTGDPNGKTLYQLFLTESLKKITKMHTDKILKGAK